jgi:hypothetical protein
VSPPKRSSAATEESPGVGIDLLVRSHSALTNGRRARSPDKRPGSISSIAIR